MVIDENSIHAKASCCLTLQMEQIEKSQACEKKGKEQKPQNTLQFSFLNARN